jgi:hypothetical protein
MLGQPMNVHRPHPVKNAHAFRQVRKRFSHAFSNYFLLLLFFSSCLLEVRMFTSFAFSFRAGRSSAWLGCYDIAFSLFQVVLLSI